MSSIKRLTNLTSTAKPKEIPIPEDGRDVFESTRERLIELVAESDDALMEKYFENGTLDEEDIYPNLAKAIANSKLCPVYAVSANNLVGLSILLDHIVEFAPNPATHEAEYGFADAEWRGDRITRKYSNDEPFSRLRFPHDRRSVCRPHQRDEGRLGQGRVRRDRL